MAKQRIHNSRAGRGGGGGSSWISYSDMMAALLLIFVLILCYSLNQYFTMLETKTKELDAQQAVVAQQQILVDEKTAALQAAQITLDEQNAQLTAAQAALDEQTALLTAQKGELDKANAALIAREDELASLQSQLITQQQALDAATEVLNAQKDALAAQTSKIDDMVGMRTQIVEQLSTSLSNSGVRTTVDPNTGDIMLESAVFFEFNSAKLSEEGKALLDRFLPAYIGVLLQAEYEEYLGEIIIEGHTDNVGEYSTNLQLSTNRANAVVDYCLSTYSLTPAQRERMRSIISSKGKSYSDPVYNEDGSINPERSRRVEFKFSLKDAEMIAEMNRILQQQGGLSN